MINRKAIVVSVLLALTAGTSEARRTNIGEVFMNSNSTECVQLQFEGFSVFMKVTPSVLTGVSVRVIGSPITSNYNPDFIVNSYPRLGTSPLLESFVVFGPVQSYLSEPVVEVLSGHDVPAGYHNFREWAGSGSEPDEVKGVKSDVHYFETEVIGHPGNLYTALSRAYRGEVPIDVNALPNALLAIPQQIAGIPATVSTTIGRVNNGVRSLGGQFSGVDFDPVTVALNQISGDLGDMLASLPGDVRSTITNAVTDGVDGITTEISSTWAQGQEIYDGAMNLLDSSVGNEADDDVSNDTAFNESDPDDPTSAGPVDELLNLDVSGLPEYIGAEVNEYLSTLTIGNVLEQFAPDTAARIQEITGGLASLTAFASSIQGISDGAGGVAARFEPWNGMCPSDTNPLTPYYLSGMNVLGWRYKIPEIVYPHTYRPFSNASTVGNFQPLAALSGNTDGESHNYGSVFPRNGYILQPDPVLASAVTAFRAAHVVTREGEPHIYTYAEPKTYPDEFVMFDAREEDLDIGETGRPASTTELRPDIETTGKWQLIHSEGGDTEQSCQLFGDPSVNPNMGTSFSPGGVLAAATGNNPTFPPQWSEGKRADDNQYVYNLWRRYRCAPDPDSSGSVTTHLFNLNLPRIDVF